MGTGRDTDSRFIFTPGEADLRLDVERAAATNKTLLILGPTGIGKTLLAKHLHSASPRAKKPFTHLNCANLPEQLVEAELFGYEKGAFTGANIAKPGLFEVADGGTVLLDELGRASNHLYHSLLKFFVDKEVLPLGSRKPRKIDVRIICATDTELGGASAALKRRLSEWPAINMRPLKVQRLKKWRLFTHFIESATGDSITKVDFLLWFLVIGYSWPGNVGQLKGFAEFLVECGYARGGTLQLDSDFAYFDSWDSLLPYRDWDWEGFSGWELEDFDSVLSAFSDDDLKDEDALRKSFLFTNRVQRDFVRIVSALQTDAPEDDIASDTEVSWRGFSGAEPDAASGAWRYPEFPWRKAWLESRQAIQEAARLYSTQMLRIKQRESRAAEVAPLVRHLPWSTGEGVSVRRENPVIPMLVDEAASLAMSGELLPRDLKNRIYACIRERCPGASRRTLQSFGVPKERSKASKQQLTGGDRTS